MYLYNAYKPCGFELINYTILYTKRGALCDITCIDDMNVLLIMVTDFISYLVINKKKPVAIGLCASLN